MGTVSFFAFTRAVAALEESDCARPWQWPGHNGERLQVRDALYLSLLEEQEAAVGAVPDGEAGRVICLAQRAFGDLRGLLAGLSDDALDRSFAKDEWTLRQVLTHILEVERSYENQTRYASSRGDEEPVYTNLRPPPPSDAEVASGVSGWVELLAAARAKSRAFFALPEAALTRPTRWAGHDVDVGFRLHRFAAHIAEHTIQCEKALDGLEIRPGEGWRIGRLISAARGAHEVVSDGGVLDSLDRRHQERLASIAPASRRA